MLSGTQPPSPPPQGPGPPLLLLLPLLPPGHWRSWRSPTEASQPKLQKDTASLLWRLPVTVITSSCIFVPAGHLEDHDVLGEGARLVAEQDFHLAQLLVQVGAVTPADNRF